MTAVQKLQQFAAAVEAEKAPFRKQAEKLEGALTLLKETGMSNITDAINEAARQAAIRSSRIGEPAPPASGRASLCPTCSSPFSPAASPGAACDKAARDS